MTFRHAPATFMPQSHAPTLIRRARRLKACVEVGFAVALGCASLWGIVEAVGWVLS
ncbi:hypothetical protein LCGC14_0961920 [marine sediment metagenome]|uniref:Uncharacterized protein n=1 Tax=marine sediment metagenome TaxID=412755 RepID=A0A0F9NE78_9ZZZZ